MPEEIEAFAAYMALPETNKAVMEHLIADFSQPPEFTATMTVISVIMNEVQS